MTIREKLESTSARSAWRRGVKQYALELLENVEEAAAYTGYSLEELAASHNLLKQAALNGAGDWTQYSEGGCALIYDADIAARLCTPSELKKTRNGERRPNSRETWIDVQARALYQAFLLLYRCAK